MKARYQVLLYQQQQQQQRRDVSGMGAAVAAIFPAAQVRACGVGRAGPMA